MTIKPFATRCRIVLEDGGQVDGFVYAERDQRALVSFQRAPAAVLSMGWWPSERVLRGVLDADRGQGGVRDRSD